MVVHLCIETFPLFDMDSLFICCKFQSRTNSDHALSQNKRSYRKEQLQTEIFKNEQSV